MPKIVGILTFMSRKDFMINWVEHEKSFIPRGPILHQLQEFPKIRLYNKSSQIPLEFEMYFSLIVKQNFSIDINEWKE